MISKAKKKNNFLPKVRPSERPLRRCLLLFSGGLDSILAAKILEEQGISVTALTFTSFFFGAEQAKKSLPRRPAPPSRGEQAGAEENGLKLLIEDISPEHFRVIRKPKFGYGAGMNPCIDCHLLMLKKAKIIAQKEGFDIIATGEVLGQRPMSQNAEALKLIEREAGLVGKILRPLSAKVLPETEYEKEKIVNREKLYGFSGRSRKGQMELAKKFGIKNYPSPAGGCILTDKEYSKKLRELLAKVKKPKPSDIELLRMGRHFWTCPVRKSNVLETKDVSLKDKHSKKITEPKIYNGVKIILGRNHAENLALKKLAEKGDFLVEPKNFPGPSVLIRGKNKEAIKFAKEKILEYAKKLENKKPEFIINEL